MYNNIILHVPHSSADFSFAGKAASDHFGRKWLEQAKDLIDWYLTNYLFLNRLAITSSRLCSTPAGHSAMWSA